MMQRFLRQSEAQEAQVGPIVDLPGTNTYAVQVFLDPQTGGPLEKGGCTRIRKNDGCGWVEGPRLAPQVDAYGYCRIFLSKDDTDTLGPMLLKSAGSPDHLPFWNTFEVLPDVVMRLLREEDL